jgi:hypothetical protein
MMRLHELLLALACVLTVAGVACTPGAPAAARPDPADADYTIELANAVASDRPLTLHLAVRDGTCEEAFATSTTFNQMPHDVDASGLKVEGSTLAGPVTVTVIPDAWVPPDGNKIECSYALQARLEDNRINGTFTGQFGGTEARGQVTGSRQPPVGSPASARFELQLEEALAGGRAWQQRALADFQLTRGALKEPALYSDHAKWYGTLDKADLTFQAGRLHGTLTATVKDGEVKGGVYTFTLDGRAIGTAIAGTCKTALDGKPVKEGRCRGTIAVAQPPA